MLYFIEENANFQPHVGNFQTDLIPKQVRVRPSETSVVNQNIATVVNHIYCQKKLLYLSEVLKTAVTLIKMYPKHGMLYAHALSHFLLVIINALIAK